MTRWTQAQLDEHLLKSNPVYIEGNIFDEPESSLQKKIVAWAKTWGHPILSLRQSKQARGYVIAGWPDITLVLHNRVLFLELKSKKGRMTEDQKNMRLMMMAHKAEFYEVRSYKQFLEIVERR